MWSLNTGFRMDIKINDKKPGVNSGALEGLAVPAPHETPLVLVLKDTYKTCGH
jgi:hypothetical protein